MSILEAKKIEPATATTVTLGAAGETVAISASQLKTNTIKDAGGNTLLTSDGSGTLSSVNSALGSTMVFISSQTASNSATVDFTSGIDSTYNEYVFYFINVQPVTDAQNFMFQVNAAGGSGFNETITSTSFYAMHKEDGSSGSLAYDNQRDQANGTSYQVLFGGVGNGSDECGVGELHLFAPSSTTYVKHFYSTSSHYHGGGYNFSYRQQGYINTTSAIDEISFKFEAGNINAGTIYMYGIK